MILIRRHTVLKTPGDILDLKHTERLAVEEAINQNQFVFFIPKEVSDFVSKQKDGGYQNALLEAYKVGFLQEMLSNLWPNRKKAEIWETIRHRFQVFSTTRKLQMRNTLYNQTPELHNVPD